jgi:hypothetical protein
VFISSAKINIGYLIVPPCTGVEEHLAFKHGLGGLAIWERREALHRGDAVRDVRAVNFKFLNNLRKQMHTGEWRLVEDEGQSIALWVCYNLLER